jgi:hypothetical protein
MPGKTTFTNRIRVGKDIGVPSQDTTSEVKLIKRVVVTAGTVLVSACLPDNSELVGAPYLVMSSSFATSAGVRVSFGVQGNINKYATVPSLNTVQATAMAVSAANIRSVGGNFVVAVSAVSGANPSGGGFNLYIPFVINQDAG